MWDWNLRHPIQKILAQQLGSQSWTQALEKHVCFLIPLQGKFHYPLIKAYIGNYTAPIIITCKENARCIVYFMHRYSQPNMLNHLTQFIDTGKEQQFRKAYDADCILRSFQGFSPPFPTLPYYSLEQLSTLKTCQKFGKQQAIRYFFFLLKL